MFLILFLQKLSADRIVVRPRRASSLAFCNARAISIAFDLAVSPVDFLSRRPVASV
jgi:hypothetical protein